MFIILHLVRDFQQQKNVEKMILKKESENHDKNCIFAKIVGVPSFLERFFDL